MDPQLASLETLFKALADRTRLRILGLLLAGEVCVCHLHETLGVPQPTVSRHLAYLRRSGLVETRRRGLWVYYRLAPAANSMLETVAGAVAHGLGHVRTVVGDRRRLEKKTGCCSIVEPTASLAFPCCQGSELVGPARLEAEAVPAAARDVPVEPARPDDRDEIFALLERNGLPTAGLADHLSTTLVARDGGRLAGTAALEIYDRAALLRSVAVDAAVRGRGLGQRLTAAALALARARGVETVCLLTETATGFFPRFGFCPVTRDDVPAAVHASVEFQSACSASAQAMLLALEPRRPNQ